MVKLEKLIRQCCPSGVKYRKISEVATCLAGATPKTSIVTYWKNGTIPWMSSGEVNNKVIYKTETKITQEGYDSCSTKIVPPNAVVIALAGQGKTRGTVAITRIALCTNQSLCSIITSSELVPEFLYHYLDGQYLKLRDISSGDGTRGGLNLKMIRDFLVPVPPLEVQQEIVRILDQFTQLTAELTAELTARKKQFSFYQTVLFQQAQNATVKYLDEISENCDNLRKPVTSGNRTKGDYPYYGASGIVDYVDNYIFDGDYLLVSEDGANLLARSTPIAFSITGKNWVNNHAHVLHFKEYATRRYVEFYLNAMDLSPYVTGGAQPKLNQKNLNRIPLTLPPLPEQRRIVAILDRFDALCNDLTGGLPAEIAARQKQYEYYRDKLLDFKELG